MSLPNVTIYTDGSGFDPVSNPAVGGWGAVLAFVVPSTGEIIEKELSGYELGTAAKADRMELMAVTVALEALTKRCRVTLHTDSQVVIRGVTKNMRGWRERDFKNEKGNSLVNDDLWRRISAQMADHVVLWEKVKAHSGHPENTRADRLAKAARKLGMRGVGRKRAA